MSDIHEPILRLQQDIKVLRRDCSDAKQLCPSRNLDELYELITRMASYMGELVDVLATKESGHAKV